MTWISRGKLYRDYEKEDKMKRLTVSVLVVAPSLFGMALA